VTGSSPEPNLANLRDIVDVLDGHLRLDFAHVSTFPDMFKTEAISVLARAVRMMERQVAVIQADIT
jgi:hypothetical protein